MSDEHVTYNLAVYIISELANFGAGKLAADAVIAGTAVTGNFFVGAGMGVLTYGITHYMSKLFSNGMIYK